MPDLACATCGNPLGDAEADLCADGRRRCDRCFKVYDSMRTPIDIGWGLMEEIKPLHREVAKTEKRRSSAYRERKQALHRKRIQF